MRERFTLKLRDHLDDPVAKRHLNQMMFTVIAPEYDAMTRTLSLGHDRAWKRFMIDRLPDSPSPVCADLACGTGDITTLLARRYPTGTILGVDLTEEMLRVATRTSQHPNVRFAVQDMGSLGIRDRSVDIVTGGYALRNAPDLETALHEVRRVLKPGGVAAFLDFSKPRARVSRATGHWLLKMWGGIWGLLLHGNPELYTYIAESLKRFPDRVALRALINQQGMELVESKLFFFGIMELLIMKRPYRQNDI